jgi:hypothetical protein
MAESLKNHEHYKRWNEDHDDEPKRPYRLWDARAKADLQYRYYSHQRNALNAGLLETAWARVGTSIEVYDCRTASHLATFTRHSTGQISRWLSRDVNVERGDAK